MVSLAVGPNGRVMASDCNPSIVEGATNALRQAGASNVEISVADCQDLSYIPSDSVDFVVANLVMHLVESPSRVVGEALRILKPGGAFCFSCGGTSNDPVGNHTIVIQHAAHILPLPQLTRPSPRSTAL